MVYRRDMLEKSGYSKPLPETFDEWTDMLTYLRDSFNMPESLMIEGTGVSLFNSAMLTGLGLTHTYILRDGKVEYTRIAPEYKTFLTYMNDWYSKKLIAQDFYTYAPMSQYTQMNELCAKDKLFALNGWTAFAGDFFRKTGVAQNPDFYISAIKDPVLNKGDKPINRAYDNSKLTFTSNNGFAVTTGAEDPVLCMRILDYLYSSEGVLLASYGPWEGTSADDTKATFYRADGNRPMVTKLLSANPEGLNMAVTFQKYALHTSAPYMIWDRETDIYDQGKKDTIAVWGDTAKESKTSVLPSNYSTTSEEGAEIASIMGDIQTYVDEMTVKFILGQEPLSNWDAYVSQVKSMNIDRACELQQNAVDRYFNRGK
jgi:putative aldouronate transport system substrate-binding protein